MQKKNILISVMAPLCLFFCSLTLLAQNKTVTPDIGAIEKIADSLMVSGKYQQATLFIEQIVEFHKQKDNIVKSATYMNLLAQCYFSKRRLEEGKKLAERALDLSMNKKHPNWKGQVESYDNLAQYFSKIDKHTVSTEYYLKSLELRKIKDKSNKERLIETYTKLATNYLFSNEHDKAKSNLDSVEVHINAVSQLSKITLAQYYSVLGRLHNLNRDFENSIQSLNESITNYQSALQTNILDLALAYQYQGTNYYHLWNLTKAEENLQKALAIYSKSHENNDTGVSACYSYLARIYTRSEEHTKALIYNKKTLTINRKLYGEGNSQVGLAYAIMAITYGRLDDHKKSLAYYKKANQNFISNFGEGHRWVVTTYENIGRAYNRLGDNQESLKNYEKAISLGKEYLGENNLIVAHVYLNAADTYALIKSNDKALELYQKALAVQIQAHGKKHREVAQNYIAQGNFYKHIHEYDKALKQYDKVIEMYKSEISQTLSAEMATEEFNVLNKIVEAIEGKAHIKLLRYKKDENLDDLIQSNEWYQQAEDIVEKMRVATVDIKDKIKFSSANQVSTRGIIETSFLLSEKENKDGHLKNAFYQSERNRARVLNQMSQRNLSSTTDERLQKLMEAEKRINQDKSLFLSRIKNEKERNTGADSVKIIAYEDELFQINLKQDSLTETMQKDYPNYFNMQSDNELKNLANIQSRLNNSTAILEYFVADSTAIYVFMVSKNEFVVRRLATPQLEKKIQKLKNSIVQKNIQSYKNAAVTLYRDLIAPIANKLVADQLIIIPDGAIWHLNFDLLLSTESESNNPKDLPYLLKDYAISYGNSADYLFRRDKAKKTIEANCLAFSYSDSLNVQVAQNISSNTLRNSKKDLPGSREEIMEIASLINGDYFYGSSANEANFKAKSNSYGILHLAIHGDVDYNTPENSKLYFTKSNDSIEDGFLYSHEIFTMNLPVELTVLSACSTGTGEIVAGEGMMSLGNAFQYAGSKSLLMTQWEISDQVAPEFMKLFYTNLKLGMNKPRALQQAKLTYLERADVFRSAPFYWGGFYLVGETAPIVLASSYNWKYFILGLPLFIFAIFFYFHNGQKKSTRP